MQKTCSLRTLTKFFKRAIPENTLRNSFLGFTFSPTCTAPYRVSSGRAAGATVFCERGIYSLKKYEQQIGANVCADSVDEIQVSWCHRAAVWAVRRVAGEWHQISAWSESGSQQYSWKLLFSIWIRRNRHQAPCSSVFESGVRYQQISGSWHTKQSGVYWTGKWTGELVQAGWEEVINFDPYTWFG